MSQQGSGNDLNQIFNEIVARALEDGISDVFIDSTGNAYAMRHNRLEYLYPDDPRASDADLLANLSALLLNGPAEQVFKERGSVDLARDFEAGRVRFKLVRAEGSIKTFARIIPKHPGSFKELRLPEQEIKHLLAPPSGLVLIAGNTGAGKTTTLAAIINHFAETIPRNIVTIEDPIEYRFESGASLITQRELGYGALQGDTPSMEQAIQDALRMRPHVVMIGEIRDAGAMYEALRLAASGHLVLTSYHAHDVSDALKRIFSSYEGVRRQEVRQLISSNLLGIIVQRLLPRADGKGLVLATETLKVNQPVRSLLLQEGDPAQLKSHTDAYSPFDASVMELYNQGLIDKIIAAANVSPKTAQQLV